jgi:hypothetical protein
MPSELDDVVVLQITRDTSALSQAGFGTPLILPASVPASFTERLRYYTAAADMLDDGFTTSDMAYVQARAIMSQSPHPERFAVGRRATAVAQFQLFVVPATPDNSTLYRIVINGTNCDYTTDASATQAELRDGLIAAINAAVGEVVTATTSTNDVLVTSDVAGIPFTYSIATGPTTPLTLPAQTQLFVIPAMVDNSSIYTVRINGTPCSYTTDASATQAELRDGLIAIINTNVGSAVTATASTNDVLVTADVAGTNFTFEIVDTSTTNDVTLGASTGARPNVGIPEDLAAIEDYQPDWYCLLITQRDRNHIMTTAAEIEAMTKIFIAQSDDAAILATPYNASDTDTDVASELHALGYDRTALVYHPDDTEALDAAVVGICLPPNAGSITWKFKSPSGIDATQLTTTELTNLRSKSANGFRNVAGVSIFYEGTMVSGEFIDIMHGTDAWAADAQASMFDFLRRAPKVPFTQKGLNAGKAPIEASLERFVRTGLFAGSLTLANGDEQVPGYVVTAPNIANISANDRATRAIPASEPYRITAPYAGAVHKVRMDAVLSV